ncbi:MAG: AMP-binding protein [Fibrobacteres bacterium]|jgi:long-chain acyl-CoA synthetase|nr:AMP-binding protein [Fibrobacterota bacterium]
MDHRYQRLLHDSLLDSSTRFPSKTALVVEGKPYRYDNLREQACNLASFLCREGLQRGDRVAIYMDNTWPCVVSIFAILMAGGTFVVVNPQTKPDKLRFILNDCGARFLFSDGHIATAFVEALADAPSIQSVIASGTLPAACPRPLIAFDSAVATPAGKLPSQIIPLDLAALIYTSGSTGNPKGVMMTHQAMTFTAGSLIEYLRLRDTDRILNVLPLAFDYGLYQLLMAMRLGATLVLERSFTYPAQILNRVQSEGVTVFPGVPTVYMTLLGMHARKPLCFPSVERVTNTAAALPADIVPRLREIFPNALIFRMYGLTECKRVCYLEPELIDVKPESVGKAIPGTEVFLLSEDGKPVPPGETGVLYVRGPHVMLGYLNRPDLSAEMLKPGKLPGERVLCTQDFFRMDAEGFLYFVGRSDDIIKSRGEKVSPIEVENCLHGIPGVREAAVVGVRDALMGEAIRAYLALEEGAALSDKEIKAHCLARLENFMVPKEVIFLPELPKTATGKIRKKELSREPL